MAGRSQPVRVEVAAHSGKQMTQRYDSDAVRDRRLSLRIAYQAHLLADDARDRPSPPIIGGSRSSFTGAYDDKARNLDTLIEVTIETATVPAIDMSAITQLADNDDLGDQFIAEITKVFLADLSERVLAVGLQMKQGDRAGIAATAHAIKGSCGHFGAVRLVELSRRLENQARREPAVDIEVAIFTMVAETERVRAALEAFRLSKTQPD